MRLTAALLKVSVVFGATCALSLNGCKKAQSASTSSTAKQTQIAAIFSEGEDFSRPVESGMREYGRPANVAVLASSSDNQSDKEFQLIQTYIDQDAEGIIISPVSATASVSALEQAHNRGMIIVTINHDIDADFTDGSVECSSSDLGIQTGKTAHKYIQDKLGGKAKIAILDFKSKTADQSDSRVNGFKGQLTDLPGVEFAVEQDATADHAQQIAADILTSHPDINIIYAADEGGTVGAVMAVAKANRAGQVAVFGTGGSEQLVGFLQSPDNILQATTAQRLFEEGQSAMRLAFAAFQHSPYEKKVVLTGICLSRTDPDGIADYNNQLKKWNAGGEK